VADIPCADPRTRVGKTSAAIKLVAFGPAGRINREMAKMAANPAVEVCALGALIPAQTA
jgi:hypothetical protein